MKKALILVLLFSVLVSRQSSAQSYHFRNYSVEDGLPFINVSTIFQDSKGNLWSGGYGGLSKFDGVSFTNYAPKEGLLNHSVTCIIEDNGGNLWIGTISGLNKYDRKIVASYTTKNGLISNSVTAAIKDTKGDLWFGTNKGISILSNGIFYNFSKKNGLIGSNIKCFYKDRDGKIWVGTTEGLSVFDGKTFTNYTTANGLSDNTINGITQDADLNMWIATANGLCRLSNNKFKRYYFNQRSNNNIITILTNHKNVIWMATNKGLVKFENEKFTDYIIRKDPNSNLISCLYEDYERNIWIGTYAGLFKYRGNPFVSYGMSDGLTNSFIHGIIRDSKNTLWAGSQGGGFYKFENNHFTQIDNKKELKAKGVAAIYEYSPGILWLGTDAGLRIYDGKEFIIKTDSSNVFNKTINCFYKDSKNNIWMGGNNDVYKYDGTKFTHYSFKARHENTQVWTIIEDKTGTIWIGTYLGGLIKHNPSDSNSENFIEYTEQLGLKNDSYLTSIIDNEGNIYLGSLDGVWMFNPSLPNIKLEHFNEDDGMSSALVYSLTFNKTQTKIWIGTNQGLNKIDIEEYKKSGKKNIIHFGKEEGFVGVECNSNGNWVDEDGSIWFGTVSGITKYDPNEYITNTAESKTNITGFQLFYTDTVLTDQIHLSSSNNNITFTYSGICLTNPDKVKYSHILEGAEKKWSPPSKSRFTTYSNLPPGTYTFKVKSSNSEGVWDKMPAQFTFTIDIPFWQTWWFLISSSLLFTIALIFSIRNRVQKIKDREIKKTELNKKIANIESQALRAQMNPHFIFNTLSSIQHYISNHDTDAALKYLTKFAKLMRSIMDNSKQPMIPVSEEMNALNLYLELEVMRFDKKFEYYITIDPAIDQNYDRIPSMLIQPYVENAIIHGLLPKDGAGKISLTLKKQDDTILCIIEDNGIGRKKSMEYKNHIVHQHKSRGMSITKERLDILNSSLNSNIDAEIIDLYENNEATGTKIKLIIPLETNQ